MKHKNILLVVFLLTMFVFQQVQAGGNLPSAGKPSEMNAPQANIYLLDEVRLGATAGIDSTTSGSMLFDQFVSHRQTYIGP